MSIYQDDNESWADLYGLERYEPWESDDELIDEPGGCHYCGGFPIREYPDPFGQQPCCDDCFLKLIGDDEHE